MPSRTIENHIVLFSEQDEALVTGKRLRVGVFNGMPYAFWNENGSPKLLHRVIMGTPAGLYVDHKNRNSLDNRRDNLRVVTNSQNKMNQKLRKDSSNSFKGVDKRTLKSGEMRFRAVCRIGQRRFKSGYFKTEREAAEAYDALVREHFGVFACTNEDLGLLCRH